MRILSEHFSGKNLVNQTALHKKLDDIFQKYHKPEYLRLDPLLCVHAFAERQEREIAGLVASVLAYGRAEIIIRNCNTLFEKTGNEISAFATTTSYSEKKKLFKGFKHRFNDHIDMALLFQIIGEIIKEYGTIEGLFVASAEKSLSMKVLLHNFSIAVKKRGERIFGCSKKSFEYLFPSPESGSACKRLNMYLRWMVRRDDSIDFGLWRRVSSSLLIIPVDTHIASLARELKLTTRKSADWAMAEEITARLRRFDPDDPVRYDFSLCRVGMVDFRKEAA
jgi:uncharacterized protein (TIGR02757 family)